LFSTRHLTTLIEAPPWIAGRSARAVANAPSRPRRPAPVEPRLSLVTLGVRDLDAATRFYRDVLELPQLPTPPQVRFFELGRTWLALYPWDELAADADVSASGTGFRGFSLAHNVRSIEEADALMAAVERGGGTIVKPARKTDWGGYSGYFSDPDGFLWEVAWNPHFPHV
jgi:uncharacterized protein